jgi:PAS domain S-box-containing protein
MKGYLRILNLEDNAQDAELNKAMLSARWEYCDLLRVDNRQDFIAALEGEDLDIILSDFTMPGFDGQQALALAREKRPNVPFLFVSGTIGEDAAIEALKNGATDYVLKHRLIRLIPAVDRALREIEERVERERAEEAMRQSEHKYRHLFENLGVAALLADQQTGKIIDANHRAEVLLDCSRARILGCQQTKFLGLADARVVEDASEVNARTTLIECNVIRKDGVTVPVSVQATQPTLYGRPLTLWLCEELPR